MNCISSVREELAQCNLFAPNDVTDGNKETSDAKSPPQQDLATLLACGKRLPIETSIEELNRKLNEKEGIWILAWSFAQLEPDEESLQQVVSRLAASNAEELKGPALMNGTLRYVSPRHLRRDLWGKSLAEADEIVGRRWKYLSVKQKQWRALLKNLQAGNYAPIASRAVLFAQPDNGMPSMWGVTLLYPAILTNPSDGSKWWGMIHQAMNQEPVTPEAIPALQDMVAMKHASSFISMLSCETGHMVWQNSSSTELYGSFRYHVRYTDPVDERAERCQHNFLELIFGHDDGNEASVHRRMTSATSLGGTFRCTVEITHPSLRSLMCLPAGKEMHLDCQVTQTIDPRSLQKVFVLCQIDVSETVISQRELQKVRDQLEADQARMDLLLKRQKELIECMGWVSGVAANAGGCPQAIQLIDRVRRQLSRTTSLQDLSLEHLSGLLLSDGSQMLLGEGKFGKVYKGLWQGSVVAIKTMTLPVTMSGNEKRERMALMEAAISSSLEHKNIVKTHSYKIKARHQRNSISEALTTSSVSAEISAFEVNLVLEYCDLGSLRSALTSGIFHPACQPDYRTILCVAMDVALGMRYLHASNIIHADLKASNILLQSGGKRVVAKISDFGLSITKIDAQETHVSNMFQGTMTHMSPECLLSGKQSNAGDVYSFGVTLYELYTAKYAFEGIPAVVFGHKVCQEHHRPIFPPGTPLGYCQLAEACWDPLPSARPSFDAIVNELAELRRELGDLDVESDLGAPNDEPRTGPLNPRVQLLRAQSAQSPSEQPTGPRELTPHDHQFWVNVFNGVQM